MSILFNRSHDGYIQTKNGFFEAASGSKYASQRTIFDDLGQGVLNNAFEGNFDVLHVPN